MYLKSLVRDLRIMRQTWNVRSPVGRQKGLLNAKNVYFFHVVLSPLIHQWKLNYLQSLLPIQTIPKGSRNISLFPPFPIMYFDFFSPAPVYQGKNCSFYSKNIHHIWFPPSKVPLGTRWITHTLKRMCKSIMKANTNPHYINFC